MHYIQSSHPSEALPILAEFKVPSLDELDVNEVIASYSEGKPKIDPET